MFSLVTLSILISCEKNVSTPTIKETPIPGVSTSVSAQVCDAKFTLLDEPKEKNQLIQLNKDISMELTQLLVKAQYKGSFVAINVLCQKLLGSHYTGSDEEWSAFIKNGLEGLKKNKVKNIQLLLTSDTVKIYPTLIDNKEYTFKGDFDGNEQIIKNLSILSTNKEYVYTISVSGNIRAKKAVEHEFSRVIDSLEFSSK
jgi:hypothetical protein